MTKIAMPTIIEELTDRIRGAEANERDHKSDPAVVRRELAGYTRGLKDALFAVRHSSKKRAGMNSDRFNALGILNQR